MRLAKEIENKQSCSAVTEMEDHKYPTDSGELHVAAVLSLTHVWEHIIAMQKLQLSVLGDTRHIGYSHGNKLVAFPVHWGVCRQIPICSSANGFLGNNTPTACS